MHQNSTKKNPKLANPLPVPQILRQSFLKTIAVDLLILPIYIYLIQTAFINIAIISPIAPPITQDIDALSIQFLSIKDQFSESYYTYYRDYLLVPPYLIEQYVQPQIKDNYYKVQQTQQQQIQQQQIQQQKMNNLNQSHKQLIFGEQIRKKQRDKIKQQIRLKFEEQTHVKNLFIHLPHSLSDIYGICRKSKSGEYLVAEAFINFVQHNKFYIEVNNLKERVFWGFIISLAFQYWPHKTNILFKSIGCNLLQQAQKQQGMELIYMVLIAAMKSVNQLSQSEQQHQQLVHYITKTISLLYYKIQNSQDLSIMSISYEGLCFLRAAFVLIPTKLSDFACYDRFLYITCIQIDRYLNKMESLQQIIKILIILTYHDGQAYQNITYFLIYGTLKLATNNNQILNTNCNNSTHCDLINKLKFILDFVDIKKSKYISANLASLIANIVQNNCQLTGQLMKNGIHQILYLNAFDDTFQQNGQKQQWKRQDSEKVRFSWRQKYQFARSYVVIVGCIYYNMQIMQEIRNRDVVEKMLKIIDSFGQTQTSILEISNHAFCRLLEIGQQIIGGQENKLNPYILKLNHLDGNHILGKFSEYFDDLFSKYDI